MSLPLIADPTPRLSPQQEKELRVAAFGRPLPSDPDRAGPSGANYVGPFDARLRKSRMNPQLVSQESVRVIAQALAKSIDIRKKGRKIVARLRAYRLRFPDDGEIAISYGQAMERMRVKAGMLELWTEIAGQFPADARAVRMLVRWQSRAGQHDAARATIAAFAASRAHSLDDRLLLAGLLGEMRDPEPARTALRELCRDHFGTPKVHMQLARKLVSDGLHHEAWETIAPIIAHPAMPRAGKTFAQNLRNGLDTLRELEPTPPAEVPIGALALGRAIRLFEGRAVPAPHTGMRSNIALVTGTIGPGGAERQFVYSAIGLKRARTGAADTDAARPTGEVRVLVRSCSREGEDNFYYRELREAGIMISQMADMASPAPVFPPNHAAALGSLMHLLPPQVTYGALCSARFFTDHAIDTAYIWQDGSVLISALGALMAGVPRIILSLRGQPPNIRLHMHRPEYLPMYQGLAAVPGVEFVANSRAGADAYAAWVGLPPSRIGVVHNGVDILPSAGTSLEMARWAAFAARTKDASVTIAGVFRHNIDKRPLLWIDMVRRYLDTDPRARFILVGNGPMTGELRERIAALGVGSRILLAGRSRCVGYWLSLSDACVLLSQFEGLPNVLLEAQAAGVPVVTTPAGGAPETVTPGVTGLVAACVAPLDLDATVAQIRTVAGWVQQNPGRRAEIRRATFARFSIRQLIENTEALLAGRAAATA